MTREEAIKLLEHISIAYTPTDAYGDYDDPQPYEEALDMAIEALKDRPQGEWADIDNYYRMATCSHCHKVTMFEKWGEYTKPYNYCPNCGADMRGEEE